MLFEVFPCIMVPEPLLSEQRKWNLLHREGVRIPSLAYQPRSSRGDLVQGKITSGEKNLKGKRPYRKAILRNDNLQEG